MKSKIHDITSYGLTNEIINDMEDACKQYIDTTLELRDSISKKNKNLKKISKKINENSKILKNKVDKYITLFEASEKDFFNNYHSARMMIKENKTSRKNKNTQAKSKNQMPVENIDEDKTITTA
jgi:hypothetical protein